MKFVTPCSCFVWQEVCFFCRGVTEQWVSSLRQMAATYGGSFLERTKTDPPPKKDKDHLLHVYVVMEKRKRERKPSTEAPNDFCFDRICKI